MNFFTEADEDALPDLVFDEPLGHNPAYEIVGYWCWRAGGHIGATACKPDSVPLYAQQGWAGGVRRNLETQAIDRDHGAARPDAPKAQR